MKLDNIRPGDRFRLLRPARNVRRTANSPAPSVPTSWVFEASDTLVTKRGLCCFLVGGGNSPCHLQGDEYVFSLDRLVVPVEKPRPLAEVLREEGGKSAWP